MTESVEAFVETPQGRIYVEREGDVSRGRSCSPPGVPAWATTTITPGSHDWRPTAVVYFDYSGCGRSDRLAEDSEYSVALFAENIEAVRQHLGLDSIDLVGLSLAGSQPSSTCSKPGPCRLVLSNAQAPPTAGSGRTSTA